MNRITPEDFDRLAGPATVPPAAQPGTAPPSVVWTAPAGSGLPNTLKPPVAGSSPVPPPTVTGFSSPFAWKIATGVLALVSVINGFGWYTTSDRLDTTYRQLVTANEQLVSTNNEVTNEKSSRRSKEERIRDLEGSLEQEKTKSQDKAPLLITGIELYNATIDGKRLSGPKTTYTSSELRYLTWEATLKNSLAGEATLNGDLFIKYIKPDGTVDRGTDSPVGFTTKKKITVSDEKIESSSWGNEAGGHYTRGQHTIQFWWQGKLVGEQGFTVE